MSTKYVRLAIRAELCIWASVNWVTISPACRLFSAKPWTKPVIINHQLGNQNEIAQI